MTSLWLVIPTQAGIHFDFDFRRALRWIGIPVVEITSESERKRKIKMGPSLRWDDEVGVVLIHG